MRNEKGFTLIEILAVVIILGIIMIITIPAVSNYIISSNRSAYASDLAAYIETVRAEYEMKDYGRYITENEIMIVPLQYIKLDKGDNLSSPFGDYVFDQCYAIIIAERKGFQVYISAVDNNGIGAIMKSYNEMKKEAIEDNVSNNIMSLTKIMSSDSAHPYVFLEKNYVYSSTRDIKKTEYSDAKVIILSKV